MSCSGAWPYCSAPPRPWRRPLGAEAASAPPLAPPPITVLTSKPGVDPGLIFVAPKQNPPSATQEGPEIIDNQGRPVWFQAVGANEQAANFRVQQYRGESVLTWWQGSGVPTGPGEGQGVNDVYDHAYRQIAVVAAGNGYQADLHEFRITPRGTAFITVYNHIPYDLSALGGIGQRHRDRRRRAGAGRGHGQGRLGVASIDHVPLSESQVAAPTSATTPYDYFHINAVNFDEDGGLFPISRRNTWTAYKVDHRTKGDHLAPGGKSFDVRAAATTARRPPGSTIPSSSTAARCVSSTTRRPSVLPYSRVVWIRHNPYDRTSTVVKRRPPRQDPGGLAGERAGSRPGPHVRGVGRHRPLLGVRRRRQPAVRRQRPHDGVGHLPRLPLRLARDARQQADRHGPENADGTVTVHAIWNGATEVARWIVIGGERASALWPLGGVEWNGLDTSITLQTDAQHVAMVAQDAHVKLGV